MLTGSWWANLIKKIPLGRCRCRLYNNIKVDANDRIGACRLMHVA